MPVLHNVSDEVFMVRVRPSGQLEASSDGGTSGVSEDDGPKTTSQSAVRKRKLGKDEYQVEKIVGRRQADEVQYLIKWKGWASKHNTWEPLSHLQNLQAEIATYEAMAAL